MSEKKAKDEKPQTGLRDDEVGQLFRQLLGPEDGPPDLTAAVPLKDTLLARGLTEWACRLEAVLYRTMNEFAGDGDYAHHTPPGVDPKVGFVGSFVKTRLWSEFGFLAVDFNSVALVLARRVADSIQPEPTAEGNQQIDAITVSGPRGLRLGQPFRLPDGRNTIVVGVIGEGRYAVVPREENYAEDGGMMEARQGPIGPGPMPRFPRATRNRRLGS